jgi:hypothetical protein
MLQIYGEMFGLDFQHVVNADVWHEVISTWTEVVSVSIFVVSKTLYETLNIEDMQLLRTQHGIILMPHPSTTPDMKQSLHRRRKQPTTEAEMEAMVLEEWERHSLPQ